MLTFFKISRIIKLTFRIFYVKSSTGNTKTKIITKNIAKNNRLIKILNIVSK